MIGIVAFVAAAFWPTPAPGFWLALLAIIFSGVGLTKARIGTASNRSLAGVGMALGLLALMAAIYAAFAH
ncbi:hypothetical protein [Nonomuraea sediminis]|uniref:hypothetical protein n=1 Tax=Nonomuraea sediminis TaxID=2835864 RepID=UPI001BDBF829|nr:hypothetical protein [Nonomuraea sediminis]